MNILRRIITFLEGLDHGNLPDGQTWAIISRRTGEYLVTINLDTWVFRRHKMQADPRFIFQSPCRSHLVGTVTMLNRKAEEHCGRYFRSGLTYRHPFDLVIVNTADLAPFDNRFDSH